MIDVVVFDLDGVVVDSEQVWDDVREQLAKERGGRWHDGAQAAMMGMSSPEWSAYMHDEIGLRESPEEINAEVVERMQERYRERLPLIDGAVEAVRRLAPEFRLGVASSSNRPLIETVLERAGIAALFDAVVSSEEVAAGKPAPDVYLEAMRRLAAEPGRTAAVEDSSNGIRAARAAGMRVLALPNAHYPPPADALALADAVIASPGRADAGARPRLAAGGVQDRDDLVVARPRGVLARRHAFPVGDVHVRAAVDQRPDRLDVGGPAVAEDDRLEQRRPAEPVDVIDVDLGGDQPPHDLRVAAVRSADQPGAVVAVLRVDVGAVRERQLEQGRIRADLARRVEVGALLGLVLRVHVRSALDQRARLVDTVRPRRLEQLRVQLRIRLVVRRRRRRSGGRGRRIAGAVTSTRPSRTQPLWPPRPIAFESATSSSTSRASFGT